MESDFVVGLGEELEQQTKNKEMLQTGAYAGAIDENDGSHGGWT